MTRNYWQSDGIAGICTRTRAPKANVATNGAESMTWARCSAETEPETLHTARNHLFACGAACRGQEMAELRRQALASVIDSAPFAFGARVLVQMPAIPSDDYQLQRFSQRISW